MPTARFVNNKPYPVVVPGERGEPITVPPGVVVEGENFRRSVSAKGLMELKDGQVPPSAAPVARPSRPSGRPTMSGDIATGAEAAVDEMNRQGQGPRYLTKSKDEWRAEVRTSTFPTENLNRGNLLGVARLLEIQVPDAEATSKEAIAGILRAAVAAQGR